MRNQLLGVSETDSAMLADVGQLAHMDTENVIPEDRNPTELPGAGVANQRFLFRIIRVVLLDVNLEQLVRIECDHTAFADLDPKSSVVQLGIARPVRSNVLQPGRLGHERLGAVFTFVHLGFVWMFLFAMGHEQCHRAEHFRADPALVNPILQSNVRKLHLLLVVFILGLRFHHHPIQPKPSSSYGDVYLQAVLTEQIELVQNHLAGITHRARDVILDGQPDPNVLPNQFQNELIRIAARR